MASPYQHPEMGIVHDPLNGPPVSNLRQLSQGARGRSASVPVSGTLKRACVVASCPNPKAVRGYCNLHARELQEQTQPQHQHVAFALDHRPARSASKYNADPVVLPTTDAGDTVTIGATEYQDLLKARDEYRKILSEQEDKTREVSQLKSQLVAMKWKTASMASLLDPDHESPQPEPEPEKKIETPIENVVKGLLKLIGELGESDEIQTRILDIVKSLTSQSMFEPIHELEKHDNVSQWIQTEFAPSRPRVASRRMSQAVKYNPSDYSLWTYSIFDENPQSLPLVIENMFETFDLFEKFNISRQKFMIFIMQVRSLYRDNPYHNFMHSVDVTQTTFYFLRRTNLVQRMELTDLDIFAMLLAAVCHDMDHPGLNNNFQINQQTPLAIRYNDISVLENHHCSKLFSLIKDPQLAFLDGMAAEDISSLRTTVINLVLNTDMSKHFGLIGKFKARIEAQAIEACDEDRQLVMSLILHAADISNPAKPFPIAAKWATAVLEEFWSQGDVEKAAGLPVSPMCERESCNKPKQQVDFITYVVKPLFEALGTVITGLEEPLHHIDNNRNTWKKLATETAEEGKSS